jgi:hypothetical protein
MSGRREGRKREEMKKRRTNRVGLSGLLSVFVVPDTDEAGETKGDTAVAGETYRRENRKHRRKKEEGVSSAYSEKERRKEKRTLCSGIDWREREVGGEDLPNDLGLEEDVGKLVSWDFADVVVGLALLELEAVGRRVPVSVSISY